MSSRRSFREYRTILIRSALLTILTVLPMSCRHQGTTSVVVTGQLVTEDQRRGIPCYIDLLDEVTTVASVTTATGTSFRFSVPCLRLYEGGSYLRYGCEGYLTGYILAGDITRLRGAKAGCTDLHLPIIGVYAPG